MSTAWQVAFAAWALLVATCAWALVVLMRRMRALETLPSRVAPQTVSGAGDAVRIRLQLTSTQPTLVTFLTDSCGVCERVVPALNELQQVLERGEVPLSAHALLAGDREPFIHRNRLSMAALQGDMDTYRELGVTATPESVLYDPDGSVIARGHPLNREQLADFLESALSYRPLAPRNDPANGADNGDAVDRFQYQTTLARGSEPPRKEGEHHE